MSEQPVHHEPREKRRSARQGMFLGATLAIGGVILLLDRLHLIHWHIDLWDVWPLLFVVWGVSKLGDPEERLSGFWLIGVGLYLTVAQLRLWGLNYAEAWPIVLVVGGIGILIDSILGPASPTRAEDRNGH